MNISVKKIATNPKRLEAAKIPTAIAKYNTAWSLGNEDQPSNAFSDTPTGSVKFRSSLCIGLILKGRFSASSRAAKTTTGVDTSAISRMFRSLE